MPGPNPALAEAAGSTDRLVVTVTTLALPERAGAVDQFSGQTAYPADVAGSTDSIIFIRTFVDYAAGADDSMPAGGLAVAQNWPAAAGELAGAADGISVTKGTAPAPTPGTAARISSPVFLLSQMPRMHLQNLLTGQWLHRDVQGVTNPSVTWSLGSPDTFSCTLSPPRADLMDPSGNPLAQEWQTACYLEEGGEIKFGGILTASQFDGPAWQPTFTGFIAYPHGIPYEGPVYKKTKIDALDVVRYLWDWVQAQTGGNMHLDVAPTKCGVLLGTATQAATLRKTTLAATLPSGSLTCTVVDPTGFAVGTDIAFDGGNVWHNVTKISKNVFTFTTKTSVNHPKGGGVIQGGTGATDPVPYELDWWNSTDVGGEIDNIAGEAVFEFRETHSWVNAATRASVRHQLVFGVPRLGTRKSALRFAEGENIVASVSGQRDGSAFANQVVGLGAGQGSSQIRGTAASVDGHLRRVLVYTDQTVQTQARMQSKAQKILASRINIDTPASIVVQDHSNAPFGSFIPGDDIYVQWVTGWRSAAVWCRVTQITQDPTTSLLTLTLARSDSYTYMAESGQAGTF